MAALPLLPAPHIYDIAHRLVVYLTVVLCGATRAEGEGGRRALWTRTATSTASAQPPHVFATRNGREIAAGRLLSFQVGVLTGVLTGVHQPPSR